MGQLLTSIDPDVVMHDVATTTIRIYFCLYATGICLANGVCQRNMSAPGDDNFTDELAQPPRSAKNERGYIMKFPRLNPGRDTRQIWLSCGLGPSVRVEGAHPTAAGNSELD